MLLLHLTGISCIIWLGNISLRHRSHWGDVEGKLGGDDLLEFVKVLYLQVAVTPH